MAKSNDWWTDFFPVFRPFFELLSPRETAEEVRYITKKLELRRGSRFLDCPCGIGRISIPLAKKGVRVTGVDITESYLDELAVKSKRLGLKIDLIRTDMRRINFDRRFDAAGNIWTSFGYFEKESDNQLVLKKIFRALKPGGKFMLHVINRDWIIRNYTSIGLTEAGRVKVLERRHFDFASSINRSEWIYLVDGREKTFMENLRLYSYHELRTMMRKAGFVDIQGFSTTRDDPVKFSQRMMFVIGTRPGR